MNGWVTKDFGDGSRRFEDVALTLKLAYCLTG
jgi:hypothetical protein